MFIRKVLLFVALVSIIASPQALLLENFDYTFNNNLTSYGWTAWGSSGTNPVKVVTPGLTFTGYSESGIGNAAEIKMLISSEDVQKSFSTVFEGNSVYASFMLKAIAASPTAVNTIKLKDATVDTYTLTINQTSVTTFRLGIGFKVSTPTYYTSDLSYGSVYVVVLKYQIVAGTNNDILSLFVFSSSIPETEPAANVSITSSGSADPAGLNIFSLEQHSSGANFIIDGIRIATTWANAPLPVELTSFTANVTKYNLLLNWETATETMNHGFEVERSLDKSNWEKVGFVNGNGNSNSPKQYSFEDRISEAGNLFYRLKQIDTDGTAEYSEPIEVLVAMPTKVELHQNYPNPFNPVTNISYSIPERTSVLLRVFDISGQLVQTLVHGFQEAGVHTASFNGEALPSGMYFLNLRTPSGMETRKIQLIK